MGRFHPPSQKATPFGVDECETGDSDYGEMSPHGGVAQRITGLPVGAPFLLQKTGVGF